MAKAADEEQGEATIRHVVIRCPADGSKDGGRYAHVVLDPGTSSQKLIEFKEDPKSQARTTHGIFVEGQPRSWQAFTLLLWVAERGEAHANDDLPIAGIRGLRGWKKDFGEQSLSTRLRKMIKGRTQVLGQEGARVWIREGVSVTIDATDTEKKAILHWAGVPFRGCADVEGSMPGASATSPQNDPPASSPPPTSRRSTRQSGARQSEPPSPRAAGRSVDEERGSRLAALKARIASALRSAPELARAMAESLGLNAGGAELSAMLSDELVTMRAMDVAEMFADLVNVLGRDGDVARNLLWEILPLAGDWRDIVEQARMAEAGGRAGPAPLELRLRTETVAEIVVARVEARCCLWASGDHYPQGARHVPLPASARAPLFDPKGIQLEAAVKAVFIDLHGDSAPATSPRSRDDALSPVRKRWASSSDFKRGVIAEMKRGVRRREPYFYMLVIDEDLERTHKKDREHAWRVVQNAIGNALPLLRLVRLTGGEVEHEREVDLALVIKDVRDSS